MVHDVVSDQAPALRAVSAPLISSSTCLGVSPPYADPPLRAGLPLNKVWSIRSVVDKGQNTNLRLMSLPYASPPRFS